jgi:outer membrane protein TolC
MIPVPARFLAGVLLGWAVVAPAAPVAGQPTAADPMAPRPPLGAPAGVRPFPSPPGVATRELTLEEAVAIALDNQPAIQARLADYLAARQRVAQALSPLLPQISSVWSAFQGTNAVAVELPGQTGPQSRRQFTTIKTENFTNSLDVTASQLLFDFGKSWAATDAARANSESSREDVEIAKDETILAVKEAYFTQLFAGRLVIVQAQALDRAELNLRSARGFYEVGTRPRFDVTRAEVDVSNARVNLIRAQNAVSQARILLNTTMGIAIDSPTRIKDILTYEDVQVDQERLVTEAMSRRPEYRQAKFRVEAADATVRQTFRNFFPDIVGVGSVGLVRSDFNQVYSIGAQMTWSIFDGGNRFARYREAQAAHEATQARLRDTELRIWQQVEQSWVAVVENRERIEAAQKAVESAQENFRLSQGRFDAGVGTIIELTDAQLALTQALNGEAEALVNYRIAVSRLERAVGRR